MSQIPAAEYAVYTDGACSGNPGPGGWGAIVVDPGGRRQEFSGYEPSTTNNRMELMAVLQGLSHVPTDSSALVVSDSQYVINGACKWLLGWKRKGWRTASGGNVLNRDLWESIDAEKERLTLRWEWVRGHREHVENNRADYLAVNAIKAAQSKLPA
ncbi:MAG: ribonuclease HI [Chloroflexi bacterium]|nr:ribonuclease HI [Chloroflexota bacterium]